MDTIVSRYIYYWGKCKDIFQWKNFTKNNFINLLEKCILNLFLVIYLSIMCNISISHIFINKKFNVKSILLIVKKMLRILLYKKLQKVVFINLLKNIFFIFLDN